MRKISKVNSNKEVQIPKRVSVGRNSNRHESDSAGSTSENGRRKSKRLPLPPLKLTTTFLTHEEPRNPVVQSFIGVRNSH